MFFRGLGKKMTTSLQGKSQTFPLTVSKAVKGDPKIAQPEACELEIVPKVAFRWMFSGPSNSGKTNLARWVLDKYYTKTPGKTFFERIYLFSPTGKLDPVWKDLDGCRPSDRITELTAEGKERLHDVFDAGLRRTKAMGKDKAPHELVIFDDAIADVKFLNSPDFLKVFVAGRHGNISCMVMTQSYVKVPRSVRMQITALAMFPSRITEIERLCDEHGPVDMSKRDFIDMVKYAIAKTETEKYPFFYLDTALTEGRRFRRGLGEVLVPHGNAGAEAMSAPAAGPSGMDAGSSSLPTQEVSPAAVASPGSSSLAEKSPAAEAPGSKAKRRGPQREATRRRKAARTVPPAGL